MERHGTREETHYLTRNRTHESDFPLFFSFPNKLPSIIACCFRACFGRLPQYCPAVQQVLFLAWKAAHYVCAKRLLPSLPTLVTLLGQHGHVQLTEEERRQVLAMSVSTAERYLRTQSKPCLHGLSATTPGPLHKAQIPVRTFAQWDEKRPGFVELDLVAHCGEHLDGRFLCTLTLTDLATGWTECIPLLYKSADAVLVALSQARRLFPFPLLGIDTFHIGTFLNAYILSLYLA